MAHAAFAAARPHTQGEVRLADARAHFGACTCSALQIHGSTHKSTNAAFKACTHVLICEPRGI
jgi:hypothetical protein